MMKREKDKLERKWKQGSEDFRLKVPIGVCLVAAGKMSDMLQLVASQKLDPRN